MSGVLEILNVGLGDLKITWDPESEEDRQRAQKMIEALLRQGYAILVQDEDSELHARATGFDRERDAYVVPEEDQATGRTKRTYRRRTTTRATAVGRSAGG